MVFGFYVIYENLDLDIWCGEIFGFVGGLGIGKIVFLNMILGFK